LTLLLRRQQIQIPQRPASHTCQSGRPQCRLREALTLGISTQKPGEALLKMNHQMNQAAKTWLRGRCPGGIGVVGGPKARSRRTRFPNLNLAKRPAPSATSTIPLAQALGGSQATVAMQKALNTWRDLQPTSAVPSCPLLQHRLGMPPHPPRCSCAGPRNCRPA